MAEKKMTRALALTNVIAYLKTIEDSERKWDDELEVLGKMLASITKSASKKAEGTSDKRKKNEELFARVFAIMPDDETIGTKWVIEKMPEIQTAPRVASIMSIGVELGKVERVKGRYIGYKKVVAEDATE